MAIPNEVRATRLAVMGARAIDDAATDVDVDLASLLCLPYVVLGQTEHRRSYRGLPALRAPQRR